jgi:hypothetical protein
MARQKLASGDGMVCELLMLFSLVSLWLGVTVLLGAGSLLIWAGAIAMAAILRPPHQRSRVPDNVTDLMSVAVTWCVAGGVIGLGADLLAPVNWSIHDLSWTFFGEVLGFYLGLLWVVVLLATRSLQPIPRPSDGPRASL